jgi:hypothetical protein
MRNFLERASLILGCPPQVSSNLANKFGETPHSGVPSIRPVQWDTLLALAEQKNASFALVRLLSAPNRWPTPGCALAFANIS